MRITALRVSLLFSRSHDTSKPVYRALAVDKDAGDNGRITYSLPEPKAARRWRIDPLTGELYLTSDWSELESIDARVRVQLVN